MNGIYKRCSACSGAGVLCEDCYLVRRDELGCSYCKHDGKQECRECSNGSEFERKVENER